MSRRLQEAYNREARNRAGTLALAAPAQASGGTSKQANKKEALGLLDVHALEEKLRVTLKRAEAGRAAGIPLRLEEREVLYGVEPALFVERYDEPITPPPSVAFVSVANRKFLPGLEALLLSLLDVYKDFKSDFYVFHDGTISSFSMQRLRDIYPKIIFEVPDMSWFANVPNQSDNQKRIGVLGYMNVMALRLESYQRVVLLDSDMLVVGDISPVWRGPNASGYDSDYVDSDAIFGCHDAGARPYAARSPGTKKFIVNSGMISLPRKFTTSAYFDEIQGLVIRSADPFCDLIDRFADQKIWNQFLADKPFVPLPANYNCNIRLLVGSLGGAEEFVRVIHFTGAKPWYHRDYLHDDDLGGTDPGADSIGFAIWRAHFRRLRATQRSSSYRAFRNSRLAPAPTQSKYGKLKGLPACFFIGNGPSLARTDLSFARDYETFGFNWLVNHPEFDEIRVDNLVLASHMLFGGWNTEEPKLPDEYLARLREKKWRPKLWVSYYFKPYIEAVSLDRDYEVDYFLLEKPFKKFVDHAGAVSTDLTQFCFDGRTGVLTAALPVAITKGYKTIGLVGCDSNYFQTTSGSNYFYNNDLHASKSTREVSLVNTWVPGGRGHYAYVVAQRQLQRMGISIVDFTIDGSLPLPRGSWDDVESAPTQVQ